MRIKNDFPVLVLLCTGLSSFQPFKNNQAASFLVHDLNSEKLNEKST